MTLHSRNKLSDRVLAKAAGTLLFLSVCSLGFSVFTYQGDRSRGQSDQEKLEHILQKAGEYCARLNRIALYFVCTEDIVERIFTPYRMLPSSVGYSKTENHYLYDYQLIREDKIEESRILLRENGIPSRLKDAPLKTQRFLYKYIIFGPIGIFGFEKQKLYDYSFEKETKLWGKPTLIVKAVPKNPNEVSCLYGKAWIDKNDGSIFRIEWEEISLGNYEAALTFAKDIGASPGLKHYSEYRIEKNGIRFPSQYTIQENYYRSQKSKYKIEKSQLLVKYKDYKFFTVDTEVKIKIR